MSSFYTIFSKSLLEEHIFMPPSFKYAFHIYWIYQFHTTNHTQVSIIGSVCLKLSVFFYSFFIFICCFQQSPFCVFWIFTVRCLCDIKQHGSPWHFRICLHKDAGERAHQNSVCLCWVNFVTKSVLIWPLVFWEAGFPHRNPQRFL